MFSDFTFVALTQDLLFQVLTVVALGPLESRSYMEIGLSRYIGRNLHPCLSGLELFCHLPGLGPHVLRKILVCVCLLILVVSVCFLEFSVGSSIQT